MKSWIENELLNSIPFKLSIPIQNLSIQFQFNSFWIVLNWLSIPIPQTPDIFSLVDAA